MYIKILISILWFGVLSAKVLFAQELQTDNLKVESNLTSPVPGTKILTREDSIKMISQENDKTVYLPFGQSSSKYIAGDVSVINPVKELNYDNSGSVSEALSGRIPGIYSGINIRGLGDALIVIDGFPGSISSVSLSEIEQITVLKDANSAMLYGVQAKNGVIMIKTKRGKANTKVINTIAETGFAIPISYPNYLGSADYMKYYNEARVNDGLAPLYTQDKIDQTINGINPYKYPDANYYNSSFLKSYKPYSRVITDFSGGNNNAQYYANMGWQRSGSLMNIGDAQHSDRLNLRSNLNLRLNDMISGHVDVVAIFNFANSQNGNFFGDASTLKPNYYPPLIDPSLVGDKKLVEAARLVNGGYLLGGTSQYRNNIYGNALVSGYNKQVNITGMFNAGLDFDLKSILKGLRLKTYASFNFQNQFSEIQTNTYAIYEPKWLTRKTLPDSLALTKIGIDSKTGTQGISNTILSRDYSFYGMLDYSHLFGKDHAVSASLLAYFDKYNLTDVFQSDKHSHLGANINYVYKDKYIVNLTSALVSSPKLSPSNRLGFSPSVALGWVISEENFLKGSSVINYLKLKASAGIINTDMSLTRYYSYEDVWAGGATYSWGEGIRSMGSTYLSSVQNINLFYEKRNELTLGFEAVLFNKSLSVDANYFVERKENQIVVSGLTNTYPSYLGGLNPAQNYNEDKNTGIEVGVSWTKSINHFSFVISPSLLYLQTTVVKRDEFFEFDYQYRTGKSTGAFFGLESLGLFKDAADIANHATQLFGTVKPGDIKYKDQNGDNYIDSNDEIMIADYNSKLVGGLSVLLKYNNLSLFALASARNGAQRFFNNSYYWVNGDVKYSEVVKDRWTPETAATATYPRLSSNSNGNNFRSSTFWLEDNSLISLERVQLTLDLPGSLAKKLFTKNFSLYCRANNILNLAGNKEKMELSIGSEPQYRYYSVGLKALF